ncbi:MAG: domain, G-beta repeat [Gemmataceae bacterium]|nr:domain, G-beta repeat [Gemmataceae bacterium]
MALLNARCPECEAALRLTAVPEPGVAVTCPKCGASFTLPAEAGPAPPRSARRPAKAGNRRPRHDAEDDRARRTHAKKAGRTTGLYVGAAAGGFLLLVGGVLVAVFAFGGKGKETAKADPPAPPAAPTNPPPKPPTPPSNPPGPVDHPAPPPGPVPATPAAETPTPPVRRPPADPDDVFARAASFIPDGPLPELPPPPPPDRRPLLTLDPGGHTAFIKNVFLTPTGDRVVTVSEDKSVRVWDVATGEPIHIIRLPAGPAEEGVLWAAALSPNGKRLAVAGFPLNRGRDGIPVYLLAVDTGRLEKVITGARAEIYALDFSPDEKWLAVGCGDGTVQGFEVATGRPTFRGAHAGIVRQVKFHPKLPPLASVGSDKTVVVWPLEGKADPVVHPLPEAGPNTIGWSSDGKTLAVGCTSGEVHLFGPPGTPARVVPPAVEANKGPIQVVRLKFLPGDKEVVYGGIAYSGWAGVIDLATGERRVQFRQHSNTVMAVNCSRDGGLAVTSGGDSNETFVWKTADGSVVRAFAGTGRPVWGVGWGRDGKAIAWGNTNGAGPDRLHPIEHTLRLDDWVRGDPPRPGAFQRHLQDDGTYSVRILDFGRFTVSENGRPLYTYETVPKGNRIYSVTLLPGGNGVVVGASGTITLLDTKTGKAVRRFAGDTGLTVSLAPSPDGRYFVSGSTDQTIRVWAPDRDEPLLSLFTVGREWIAWTPQGYYSCSASGERLIAWQLNAGVGKLPAVHPAVRFRASLYQPALIKYLLPAGNLQLALAMAAKFDRQQIAVTSLADVLPPEPTIVAPAEGEVTVTGEVLTVRAAAAGTGKHPVLALRLIVDGRPFRGEAGIKRVPPGAKAEAEWTVPLTPGVHSLAVLAESAVSKGLSRPLVATRTGTGPPPNLYVLAVGVSDYPGDMKLRYAASDADLLRRAFTEGGKGVFGAVEVKVVTDAGASRKGILAGLDWLAAKMTPKDVGVFAFSGHGTRDLLGRFYLAPVDAGDDVEATCLGGDEIKTRLGNMPGRLVAILDACHSGAAAAGAPPARVGRADNLVRDLVTDDYGVVVMCASLGREYALEGEDTKAGYFTRGLVEGLSGKADLNKDGVVFIHELDAYTAVRVAQLSEGRQHPVTGRPPTLRLFAVAKP